MQNALTRWIDELTRVDRAFCVSGEDDMYAQWVPSSAGLPHEGQPVEFMLDNRQTAMGGTYVRQIFRSRWMGYEVDRVRRWRAAPMEASITASARPSDGHDAHP